MFFLGTEFRSFSLVAFSCNIKLRTKKISYSGYAYVSGCKNMKNAAIMNRAFQKFRVIHFLFYFQSVKKLTLIPILII